MARFKWARLVVSIVVITALGFSPAAAVPPPDPCADPAANPLCAVAPQAGAACVAVGLAVGGSVDLTFAESRAVSNGQTHQERQLASRQTPDGSANVITSRCDAHGPPAEADGSASAASFSTDLTAQGVPVMLEGVAFATNANAASGGGGSGTTVEQGRLVVNGTEILVATNQAPNTVIPLGESSFVVLNEQHVSPSESPCTRVTAAALRIHLAELDIEVVVGWVSLVACRMPATIETFAEPQGEIAPGQLVSDFAFVSGPGPTPTGTIDFFLCRPFEVTPAGCEAPNGIFVGTSPLYGGTANADEGAVATGSGRHCWRVAYSGDDVYLPGEHTNNITECFTVVEQAQPQLQTFSRPQGCCHPVGIPANDEAMLIGGQEPYGGTMTFFICRPFEVMPGIGCPFGGDFVGNVPVGPDGMAFSPSFPVTDMGGVYCWRAEYSGDPRNLPVSHTNYDSECFTIQQPQAQTQMTTRSQPNGGPHPQGIIVVDRAIIQPAPGYPVPTGFVDFFLCRPFEVVSGFGCPQGAGAFVGTSPVSMGEAFSPPWSDTMMSGTYCWRARYSGDAIYTPATHTDFGEECFTIV